MTRDELRDRAVEAAVAALQERLLWFAVPVRVAALQRLMETYNGRQ